MKLNRTMAVLASMLVLLPVCVVPASASTEEGSQPRATVPKVSLQQVWAQVLRNQDQMTQLIAMKNLAEVEHPAFRIRDLVAKLPDLSTKLPPDRMTKLKVAVGEVGKLAMDLDNTGDSGNQAGTEVNAKKLDEVL